MIIPLDYNDLAIYLSGYKPETPALIGCLIRQPITDSSVSSRWVNL